MAKLSPNAASKRASVTIKAENTNVDFKPYIAPSKKLPEITLKACLLSMILAVLMAGSNAYLGLKVGMTVSATIPAAVISMAVLRFFRKSNVLENNIVQTAASAGEAIAAAVVFTLPALLMLGYWREFPFVITASIVIVGGILGVLFSIPLRRAFILESELKFPEGVATGEVLKAGDGGEKEGARDLVVGGLLAAFVKFGQAGLLIFSESLQYWMRLGHTVAGFGAGLSVVMVGAGYIIGPMVGISLLLGAIIAWLIGVPLFAFFEGIPAGESAYDIAVSIWSKKMRMIGVGAMVIGGIWTLIYLFAPIKRAILTSFETLRKIRKGERAEILRTEHDIPMPIVLIGCALLIIPLFLVFHHVMRTSGIVLTPERYWSALIAITIFSMVAGFICASIAGYMAGLLGSSNSPISGVTIIAVLSSSLLLLFLIGTQLGLDGSKLKGLSAAAVTIIVGSIMATASAVSGDNLQDLKAGQWVGATPWKQQVMLMLGVIVGALAITPILQILFEAYGIGDVLPRPGMDPTKTLAAPKAAVMAAIAGGVFEQTLEWSLLAIGAIIAVAVIIVDEIFIMKKSHWRLPILAVAVGIYMPLDVTVPVFVGGLIAYFANRRLARHKVDLGTHYEKVAAQGRHRGMLFSSGLIAGEALVGLALAIPFAAYHNTNLFRIVPAGFETMTMSVGTLAFIAVGYYLYRIGSAIKI